MAGKVNSLDYADFKTYQFLDDEQGVALAFRQHLGEDQMASVQVADSKEAGLAKVTVRLIVSSSPIGALEY